MVLISILDFQETSVYPQSTNAETEEEKEKWFAHIYRRSVAEIEPVLQGLCAH